MTTENQTEELKNISNLTDEAIMQIATKIDQLIVDVGQEHQPTPIQMAAIALGRLMVFTKHCNCYTVFCDMMSDVIKMSEPEITKTEDVQ